MSAKRPATVDRRFFEATAEGLARLGFDIDAACDAHALTNPLRAHGDRLPLAAISPIYELAARELGDPAFAYQLVTRRSHELSSALFPLALCSETPMQALRTVCRFAAIASDACRFRIAEHAHGVVLQLVPPTDTPVSAYQVEMAAWFLMQWQLALRGEAKVTLDASVRFRHAPLFEPARYEQLYGAPVGFLAPDNSISLHGSGLRAPMPDHDERLLAHRRHQAERYEVTTLFEGDLPNKVMMLYAQRMALSRPDADQIAALMNMSRRTLQRRLQEAGTSWLDVIEQARQQVACAELLQGEVSVTDLALLTGYEDTRAFLRAFKRWTGLTPSGFRQKHRG